MVALIGSLTGLLFVCIPIIWIVMHYSQQRSNRGSLTEEEVRQLEELVQVADTMAERIKALEAILDAEYPDWREHDGKE